jgi:hypothetical protein
MINTKNFKSQVLFFLKSEGSLCDAVTSVYEGFLRAIHSSEPLDEKGRKVVELALNEILKKVNRSCYLCSWNPETDEIVVGVGHLKYTFMLKDKNNEEQEIVCVTTLVPK